MGGGKVLYFQVTRKGPATRWPALTSGMSWEEKMDKYETFKEKHAAEVAELEKRPILSFELKVRKGTRGVTFRSEKTVQEWEQHRLPVAQPAHNSGRKSRNSAMKPTDKVKKSVQLRLM